MNTKLKALAITLMSAIAISAHADNPGNGVYEEKCQASWDEDNTGTHYYCWLDGAKVYPPEDYGNILGFEVLSYKPVPAKHPKYLILKVRKSPEL